MREGQVAEKGSWLNRDEVWSTQTSSATGFFAPSNLKCAFSVDKVNVDTDMDAVLSASLIVGIAKVIDGRPERSETAFRRQGASSNETGPGHDLVARVHEIPWNGILWKSTGLLEGSCGLRRGLHRNSRTMTLRPHHAKCDAKDPICQQYTKRHRTHSSAHQHEQIQ